MAGIFSESFETGPAGSAVSTSNSAFTGLVETGWTFVADPETSEGSLAGQVSVTGAHAIAKRAFTATTSAYVTFFLKMAAAPTTDTTIANLRGAGALLADMVLTTDRRLAIRNSGSVRIAVTPASTIPLGAYCRVEWLLNTSADQQKLRIYTASPRGTTADYDSGLIATTAVGQADTFNVGVISASTWTGKFDAVSVDDAAFRNFGGGGGGTVGFRASAENMTTGTGANSTITMPTTGPGGTVAAGDLAILSFWGSGGAWTEATPTGWTKIAGQAASAITFNLWSKVLVSGDLGATVTVVSSGGSGSYNRDLNLEVFSTAQLGAVSSALATVAATAHLTPSVPAVDPGAWVLNGCGDRASPGSQSWTLPSNLTLRQQHFGTGGGVVSTVTATDGAPGAGSVGSNTITGTVSTANCAVFSVVIEPSGATPGGTVNAGSDLTKEPWAAVSITATSTGTPTAWAWTQVSPPTTVLSLTGATTATVGFTCPAVFGVTRIFKLRATATYSGGATASDDVNITVYPATEAIVDASGASIPYRKSVVL